jgi:DNA-binding NarL/FixJ family response regulator
MARSVLIVDDHAGFRASARAILEADGFEVVGEAASGAEAVDAINRLGPEIVILDVQRPDMTGFDVCEECLPAGRTAPAIVLVSSRDAEEYGSLIAASGARGFVAKADLSGEAVLDLLP